MAKKQSSIFKIISTVLVLVILIAGFLGTAWVMTQNSGKTESASKPILPVVRTFTVRDTAENDTWSFPGFAKEGCRAKVAFRVAGPLCELNTNIGQRVNKGDVLARIDPRDFELAIQRLNSNLTEAESMYTAMKTGARTEDRQALESQLEAAVSAEDTARSQHDRMKNLLETQTASRAQYDQAKMAWDVAKGQREALQKQLEKAKAGSRPEEIAAMEAKIAGIKTDLQIANNARTDSTLTAPFDGYVVQKFVENHEIVTPGMSIVELSDAQQIEITVNIPESVLIREKDFNEDSFSCLFESFPDVQFKAKLKEIGQALQLGKQSYPLTLAVDLTSANTSVPPTIRPGLAVQVKLSLKKEKPGLFVPPTALVSTANITRNTVDNTAADTAANTTANTAANTTANTVTNTANNTADSIVANTTVKAEDKAAGTDLAKDTLKKTVTAAAKDMYVFTLDTTTLTVHARPVTIDRILPEGAEVTSGMKPGDIIVSAGARFLKDGQKVRLEE